MNTSKKGFTLVELLVVIGILGILMGVLVPQITGSMFTSNLNAMSWNGGKLIKAIIGENATKGGSRDLWAHKSEADGKTDDTTEICGMDFSKSTDYFLQLFDVQHQTSSDWSPFVDGDLLSTLWGFGVPPAKPGNLTSSSVGWTMVKGMPDTADATIPVMVSRNVDTSNFAKSGASNDMSTKKTIPALDKYTQPFAKKGAVIVYKSGKSVGLKKNDARLCDIYRDQPNVSFADGITLEYMEP